MPEHPTHNRVAIVGGGFTGAAVAYHLAHLRFGGEIVVFEPRRSLGGGLAYDTTDPAHRINVPAAKMSLVPGDDAHFARWITKTNAISDDIDALAADGNIYPRRSVFGRYVAEEIAPFLAARLVIHERQPVERIERAGAGWVVTGANGRTFHADAVVLATTHPAPGVPAVLDRSIGSDQRLIRDATVEGALDGIAPHARVLIVGTGLTMADVVASLTARGHRGPITAVSRRGLLSRPHPPAAVVPFGTFTDRSHTALSLLRTVRDTIAAAADQGQGWQCVIDAVRAQAQTFWPTLGLDDRRRIVRHLRPFWDVHRFRVAPQVDAVIRIRRIAGSLDVFAAALRRVSATPEGINVEFERRHSRRVETRTFDAIVVTTGPAHDRALTTEPHLAEIADQGWITADPTGLGISCDVRGNAFDRAGRTVPNLFIAGPLARGRFGELMGLPQVSDYARDIARAVYATVLPASVERRLCVAERQ